MTEENLESEQEESYILIKFPQKYIAECQVTPVNVSQGQKEAAAFRLSTLVARDLNDAITAELMELQKEEMKKAKNALAIQSIMRDATLKTQ